MVGGAGFGVQWRRGYDEAVRREEELDVLKGGWGGMRLDRPGGVIKG
jgi:hypothetical protein